MALKYGAVFHCEMEVFDEVSCSNGIVIMGDDGERSSNVAIGDGSIILGGNLEGFSLAYPRALSYDVGMTRQAMERAIRSIEHYLLVVLVFCLALGAIGFIGQIIRWGSLLEPCCGD